MKSPTPDQIRALRRKAGMNTGLFGALVSVSGRTVEDYEQGRYPCPPDRWELWQIKVARESEVSD